jgi:hypothetical protein
MYLPATPMYLPATPARENPAALNQHPSGSFVVRRPISSRWHQVHLHTTTERTSLVMTSISDIDRNADYAVNNFDTPSIGLMTTLV